MLLLLSLLSFVVFVVWSGVAVVVWALVVCSDVALVVWSSDVVVVVVVVVVVCVGSGSLGQKRFLREFSSFFLTSS